MKVAAILSAVKKGAKFLDKNITYVMAIGIAILIILLFRSHDKVVELKNEVEFNNKMHNNNIEALKGDIKYIRDDVGGLLAYKTSFISELEDLKKYDEALYKEIKDVPGDVISYIRTNFDVDIPKFEVDNDLVKYDDGYTYGLKFNTPFKDNGIKFNSFGESQFKLLDNKIVPGKTMIDSTKLEIGLKYGMREFEDRYEAFAYSPSPLVTFKELDGSLIIQKPNTVINPSIKPSRFCWGVSFGYMYAPEVNKFHFTIGPTLTYKITSFPFGR